VNLLEYHHKIRDARFPALYPGGKFWVFASNTLFAKFGIKSHFTKNNFSLYFYNDIVAGRTVAG
jgi:hypothetical protein